MGRHQDPGPGARPHCPPPVPQAEDEGGGSTAEGGGGEGTQAADGQAKGTRDCRNEVLGEFSFNAFCLCVVFECRGQGLFQVSLNGRFLLSLAYLIC